MAAAARLVSICFSELLTFFDKCDFITKFYALVNKVLALKIVSTRKNFDGIVDVMLWQDSSDDSSSSEDDLDELLLEFMFPQQNDANYPRINLQDIPDIQCEAMFRYKFFAFYLFLNGQVLCL